MNTSEYRNFWVAFLTVTLKKAGLIVELSDSDITSMIVVAETFGGIKQVRAVLPAAKDLNVRQLRYIVGQLRVGVEVVKHL